MMSNKFIYDFWKTVFYFALSAVQLNVGMLNARDVCNLKKNKEVILYLTKKKIKKKQQVVGSNKVVLPHTFSPIMP